MTDTPSQAGPEPISKIVPGQHLKFGLPFSTEWRTLTVQGVPVIVLHIEHATGATDLPMPADMAEQVLSIGLRVARQLQGKPTGEITIASPGDVGKISKIR